MANAKFSQGLRDNMLSGTTAIETAFDLGNLDIYDGTQPTSANDVVGAGTLLASVDLPASAFAAISNGVLSIDSAAWEELSAIAASTATWFRLMTTSDTGASSTTEIRIDGDVTTVAVGTGDLQMTSTTIAIADKVTVDTFTITVPE